MPSHRSDETLIITTEVDITESNRIKTYITGFDEVIGGGFPSQQVVLVTGSPGAMKSSVTYYILHHNAIENNLTSLYICFEEERETFIRNMSALGMSHDYTKIIILDADDRLFLTDKAEQWQAIGWTEQKLGESPFISGIKYAINRAKEKLGISLLVIDSINSLVLVSKMSDPRDDIFKLFEWIREQGLTALVIAETPAIHPALLEGEGYNEDFLADGILELKMEKMNDLVYRRYLRCVKMRTTEHSPDYFNLIYDDQKHTFEVTKALY